MQEATMRSSTVVAILLRLLAIYWLVQAALGIPSVIMSVAIGRGPAGWLPAAGLIMTPVLYGFLAFLAWIFAGAVATKVAGQGDPVVPFLQISRADLFAFGLLILGLYFFLSYLGSSVNWLHYLAINGAENPDGSSAMYELSMQAIPCVTGLLIAITSAKFGRKLAGEQGVAPVPET